MKQQNHFTDHGTVLTPFIMLKEMEVNFRVFINTN